MAISQVICTGPRLISNIKVMEQISDTINVTVRIIKQDYFNGFQEISKVNYKYVISM